MPKGADASLEHLDLVLSNLSEDREEVFGVWTNGKDMTFRMRTYDSAPGISSANPKLTFISRY